MTIYLASPLFTEDELETIRRTENLLRNRGINVWSPREHECREGFQVGSPEWAQSIFRMDVENLETADIVVALYYGNDSDSGTAFEIGYAIARHIPVVLVHLTREPSNLMCHIPAAANLNSVDELLDYDFKHLPPVPYQGNAM